MPDSGSPVIELRNAQHALLQDIEALSGEYPNAGFGDGKSRITLGDANMMGFAKDAVRVAEDSEGGLVMEK